MSHAAETVGVAAAASTAESKADSAKRVTVLFAPQTYAKLTSIATRKGITKTEALRQSISLTDYLESAMIDEGAKVFVERNGKLSEIVLH